MKHTRSLRSQLTLAGFAAIYLAVLILFGISWLTEDVSVTTTNGVDVTEPTSDDGFGWVEIAVLALAPTSALLAWWWAGRAVRPIDRIRTVAERIEATDLSERIDLRHGPPEIISLARSFDGMLDRLHQSATRQLQVIDEISHELRTPIAVLIANADVRLAASDPSLRWYREGLEQSQLTAQRMLTTLERLLVDARSSARTLDRHPADLVDTISTVSDEMTLVAARKHVTVELAAPSTLRGSWDTPSIARAITNLLDNAIRHAPGHTKVTVAVHSRTDRIDIAVSDHGPGIDPASPPENTRRPVQTDEHDTARNGLGLAITRQIAEAHGGDLTIVSPDPAGYATTVTFTIKP